jgi:hypothetical protein
MSHMPGAAEFTQAHAYAQPAPAAAMGAVFQIAGSSSKILIDAGCIAALAHEADPCIAMAGQVGSQVKMRVGNSWLIASVRSMALDRQDSGMIVADVDFLGEGDEEKLTGRIYHFRRGVTRYPAPGTEIFPVSSADMQQIYAADDRPHVQIGTVYPRRHARSALCGLHVGQAFRPAGFDGYW